jgi:hypothetical protein
MATEAQIEANRRNAQKSSGPRTTAGKARVSRNAARHGLCNTIAVMSDENQAQFQEILDDLNEEHQPEGTTETILVYKMALNFLSTWRANVLLTERLDINDTCDDSKQVALMLRYFNTADRAFNKNLNDLRKLQKERQKEEIGFVPQLKLPVLTPPVEPPVQSNVPPETVDDRSCPSPLDPNTQPLELVPPRKSPGGSPGMAA